MSLSNHGNSVYLHNKVFFENKLANIGFAIHPIFKKLVFLAFWVSPNYFCDSSIKVSTIEEFIARAKEISDNGI